MRRRPHSAILIGLSVMAVFFVPARHLGGDSSLVKKGVTMKQACHIRDEEPEKLTFKKEDIIKILIDEKVKASINDELDTEKEVTRSAGFTAFPRFSLSNGPGYLTGASVEDPQLAWRSSWGNDADGSREREDRFKAEIAAKVVEVKPNGNVILEARRSINIGEDRMLLTLSAEASKEFIGTDYTIKSSELHDVRIEQKMVGSVAASTKRGWLTRFFDKIDPF